MDTKKLFDAVESKKELYLNFLKDIVEIESPTSFKEGVDAVGNYFIEKAKKHNWKTEVFNQEISGNVVVITMNSDLKSKPICLSGHIDTVHPVGLFGNPCVKQEGNKITGPGIADCKGGCVNAFWAMDALSEMEYRERPIMLLLQSDEETSSRESNKETIKYIVERSKDAVAFFNMEPSVTGGVTLIRKGIAKFEFSISGKSEHASRCYNGLSAIAEAAHKILLLEKHKDKDGITFNCGTIKGGTVPNTVPDLCVFTLDTRFKDNAQYEQVKEIIKKIADDNMIEGTSCKIQELSVRAPMPRAERNFDLLKEINKALKKVGFDELQMINNTGGSDAAYVTLAGIPVVDSLAVKGYRAHSPQEHILADEFLFATKRIAAIMALTFNS